MPVRESPALDRAPRYLTICGKIINFVAISFWHRLPASAAAGKQTVILCSHYHSAAEPSGAIIIARGASRWTCSHTVSLHYLSLPHRDGRH